MMCLPAPLMADSGDQEFFSTNMNFATMIRNYVVGIKERLHADLIAVPDNTLEHMRDRYHPGIPSLNCQSDPCNVGDCFNQIRAGLHIYEGYLSQIAEAIPSYAERVLMLRRTVHSLSANIQKQMEKTDLPTVTYPEAEQLLTTLGNWKDIVGSYFILDYLKNFLEMTFRSLRDCST